MGDVGSPGHDFAFGKDRHGQHHVIQMGDPAVVGIVGDEDITRFNVGRLIKLLHYLFDRLIEDADEGRDAGPGTGYLTMPVGDAGTHIEHFVDNCAHGGPAHRGEHFVGCRL